MIERLLLSMPRGLPMHQDGTVCPAQEKRGGEEERGRRGGEKQADEAKMDQSRAVRVLEQRTGEEEMERKGGVRSRQTNRSTIDQVGAVRVLEQRRGEEEMKRKGGGKAGRRGDPPCTRPQHSFFYSNAERKRRWRGTGGESRQTKRSTKRPAKAAP